VCSTTANTLTYRFWWVCPDDKPIAPRLKSCDFASEAEAFAFARFLLERSPGTLCCIEPITGKWAAVKP
jgi:hypothetical protein